GRHGHGVGRIVAGQLGGLLERFLAAAGQRHLVAVLEQGKRRGAANAAARAGDDRDFCHGVPPRAPTLADCRAEVEASVLPTQTEAMLRRSFVAGFGGFWLPVRARAEPKLAADPFALGVASGRPKPDSIVLWTRLMAAGDRSERLVAPMLV